MNKEKYLEWSKQDLIKEIKKLDKRKKYGIVWEDKPEDVAKRCKNELPILEEDTKKEIKKDDDKPVNILIEGDNYHALSVLNYTHKGKVDVIYIDPPYNTGAKDFMYNDKYVDREDSYFHSKWLSFMEKRLKLTKFLLKNNGLIFISIDDNEYAQLKILCDEVFGENNFVNTIIVKPANPVGLKMKNADKRIIRTKEYVLVYAKNYKQIKFKPQYTAYEDFDHFNLFLDKNGSKDPNKWEVKKIKEVIAQKHKKDLKELSRSEIKSFCLENMDKIYCSSFIADRRDRIEFSKKNPTKVTIYKNPDSSEMYMYKKRALFPLMSKAKNIDGNLIPATILCDLWLDIKWDGIAVEGGVTFQNGKKPVKLIKRILNLVDPQKKAIILDFMAGSGTTGQAVLELNKEEKGGRRFILCTNNEGEICSKVCYPRLKNVITGYKNKIGTKGNLKYFKTDFVDAKPTDKNKRKMVNKSTEMLCLKEECFDEIKKGTYFKIFKNSQDKYLGIIYDDDGIKPLKKEIKKLNKQFVVYVFSLDESAREEEFEDIAGFVELKPIPAVILNVYKRIFK